MRASLLHVDNFYSLIP